MDPDQSQIPQQAPVETSAPAAQPPSSVESGAPSSAPGPAPGDDNPLLATMAGPGGAPPAGSPAPGGAAPAPSTTSTIGSIWDAFSLPSALTNDEGAAGTGLVGGIKDGATGVSEIANGKVGDGVVDLGKGVLEAGSGAIGLTGAAPTSGLGMLGGALGGIGGVISGVSDMMTGANEAKSKDGQTQTTGVLDFIKGDLETVGGLFSGGAAAVGGGVGLGADAGAALAAGGAGAASVVGQVAAAGAAGIGAGIGMEKLGKQSGAITESGVVGPDGKPIAESGAEKVADWGQDVANLMDPSRPGHPGGGTGPGLLDGNFSADGLQSTTAKMMGLETTILGSPVGGLMDIGAAINSGETSAYNWLKKEL